MGKELIINLLLLWALSGNAAANGNYYFRHYSNRDGLSHNTVYAAIQDSKGFMWFATEAGLNRFDGHDFRVFRNLPGTASSLLKDNIHDVFEDSKGRIWVCTSGGMCSFNYEDETFTPLILPGQSQPYFARQVLEDGKGFLWLRYHFYFTRYNPDTKEFKTFPSAEYGFRTIHMTINSDGGIVFADQKSIYVYNYENENFTQTVNFADKFNNRLTILTRIQEIPHIGYLIGTDLEGLKLYHSNSGEIETLIGGIHVRNILNYDSNTYWIASESGIYIYNFIDRTTVNLRKSLTNDYSIADNAIYSLTKDSEGGIWATSFFGGVNYLPKTNGNFTYYIGGKTHPEMLGNTVREICPDNDGNLWLATEDNGVNRYNPQTGEMLNITRPVLSSTNIHGLYVQGDTLWIGTFNRGIDLLQISTGKVLRSYRVGNTDRRLQSNFVLCFSRLRSGDFLVGTHQGVFRYLPQEDSFEKWRATNHNTRHIFEDHRGNVWVTTQECLYRATPDSLYVYSRDNKSLKGLGSHNTTSVFEDSKQRIWITTEGGLSLYDAVADTFGTLTTADGLPSNLVYRIVEDRDGLFWISTSCGLLRFNPDSRAMHVYSYSDGLFEAQFNYSSSYMSPEGVVYMGTVRGMLSFRPHAFIANDFTPRLYIRRVHVHDNPARDMYLLDSKTQPVLRLPYNSATFTISYIAPSYTSPDAIKYSYRLEGVDRDWLEMDNFRDVTFANLSPGTYLFKVRSTNGSDEWILAMRRIDVIISDIMMPEMDGYELCNAVKNNLDYSHIPFIALTARHDLQSRLTGLNSGADAYLEKPFSLEHMVLQVENLLRNRERLLRSYLEKPFTPLSSLAASQADNLFIEKLNAVIDRDITVTDLSVEGLSKEMNMSQASFYRKVKALAGISPVDFIRMARLKKAIVLMQQGERRISEIAYAAGFSSPAYFSTTFQKQYSKTPTEFIKEMQNTN